MIAPAEPRTAPQALPGPGQLVRVRSRSWVGEEVVPPRTSSDQTLVCLSRLDDDAQCDQRFGAGPRLLTLLRLLHDGAGTSRTRAHPAKWSHVSGPAG